MGCYSLLQLVLWTKLRWAPDICICIQAEGKSYKNMF